MPSSIAGTSSQSFSRTRSGSEASLLSTGSCSTLPTSTGARTRCTSPAPIPGLEREAHETRWTELLESFERALLEPVVVESSDEGELLRAFLRWSELRQAGADAW